MAQPRKTFSVADFKAKVNQSLRLSVASASAERLAMASLLESVLMDSNNYRGFRYLDIATDSEGNYLRNEEGNVIDFGDESRREYY